MNNTIPTHLRPFLELKFVDIPPQHISVFNAIEEAVKAIDGKINIDKKYFIILGTSPFEIETGEAGTLTYISDNPVICHTSGNMIFLDYLKLSARPFPTVVAIILEEFVHAIMNVADENLVKDIVCVLYPQVRYVCGSGYQADQPLNGRES